MVPIVHLRGGQYPVQKRGVHSNVAVLDECNGEHGKAEDGEYFDPDSERKQQPVAGHDLEQYVDDMESIGIQPIHTLRAVVYRMKAPQPRIFVLPAVDPIVHKLKDNECEHDLQPD